MNILEEIATKRKIAVEMKKQTKLSEEIPRMASEIASRETADGGFGFPFRQSLTEPGISFICEVKKASPSRGVIAEDFPYLDIAGEYEEAGASAISVLTEPEYFMGSDRYLQEIAGQVNVPVLRKDFIVDEFQIYEAKTLGASAVLLICAILSDDALQYYIEVAHSLGMDALVETHDKTEVGRALRARADIIGVNNRDLRTFDVDVETSIRLRRMVPDNIVFVSESGIKTGEDVSRLSASGIDAVLIGETLMRSADKRAALDELRGQSK